MVALALLGFASLVGLGWLGHLAITGAERLVRPRRRVEFDEKGPAGLDAMEASGRAGGS